MAAAARGDVFRKVRTFRDEDVAAFAALSGDRGRQHLERDATGRLMVHGLLTATIPTAVGGDLHYLAREMRFEFVRPVFSGDTVTCEVTVVEATREEGRTALATLAVCRNQHGKEVLRASGRGVVLDRPTGT